MRSALRLSIGANLVLLGVVAFLLWRDHAAVPSSVSPAVRTVPARSDSPLAQALAQAPQPKSTEPKLSPAAMAELERMGISRDLIVSALLEDFRRRWDLRFTELQQKHAPKQVPERENIALARRRDAAQVRALQEALGEEGYLAWDQDQTLRRLNSAGLPLTTAEAQQAYRLQKEFDQKHRELQMAMEDGVADMADAGALQAQAQEALERQLEQLLGKPRLAAMRGIDDPIAEVSWKYGELNPTPDQANAVLRAEGDHRARETALARRLKETPGDAVNVTAELKAMNDAQEESLRRIFGAETYDQQQRQNDPRHRILQQYAEVWGIKDHEIQPVFETLRAFHDQADRMRRAGAMSEAAGQRVNWPEIESVVEQARQRTEAGLENLVGGERLRRLKQNGLLTGR
jgi:hypothetical protein